MARKGTPYLYRKERYVNFIVTLLVCEDLHILNLTLAQGLMKSLSVRLLRRKERIRRSFERVMQERRGLKHTINGSRR